ncbi:MAG: hypothetical protein J0L92_26165 [Deltaproteobacteria bacterium]|nr:hypothetical protein [Deltaproteobacteria bacterium]
MSFLRVALAACSLLSIAASSSGCSCADSHSATDASSPPRADASLDAPAPELDAPALDAPGLDAFTSLPDAQRPDADGVCTSYRLRDMRIEEITSLEAIDVHASRSFRVGARYTQTDTCHSRAMTNVEIDPATHTVNLTVRDWVQEGVGCGELAREDQRAITLHLESGDWTIRDASEGGTASLAITIGPGIRAVCRPDGGDCLQDCDCLERDVCLSAVGKGGPFTACAAPCEEDLDCDGAARCTSFDDGFDRVCTPSAACGTASDCLEGFECEAGACTPTFTLGSSTRTECDCDADCEAGLSCVTGATGSRCEARCATGGRWCTGAHFCGEARQDVAGLAPTDAVCVSAGE